MRTCQTTHLIVISTLLDLFATASLMKLQLVKGDVINTAIDHTFAPSQAWLTLMLWLFLSMSLLFAATRASAWFRTQTMAAMRTRLAHADVTAFGLGVNDKTPGQRLALFTTQLNQVNTMGLSVLMQSVGFALSLTLALLTLGVIHISLAGLALALALVSVIVPRALEARVMRMADAKRLAFERCLHFVTDRVRCLNVIKDYSLEGVIARALGEELEHYAIHDRAFNDARTVSVAISMACSSGSLVVLVGLGLALVVHGTIDVGQFVAACTIAQTLIRPFFFLSRAFQTLKAVKPVRTAVHMAMEPPPPNRKRPLVEPFESLALAHAVVRRTDHDLACLNDVSWSIRRGERILIEGPSGSGKTTLIDVLLGQCPLTAGSRTVNGRLDADGVDMVQVAAVCRQHPVCLPDPLRSVLSGSEMRSDECLVAQLKALKLHTFASVDKLASVVAGDDQPGSGGERARIAVARTLLSHKPLLIFDEPLANLDPHLATVVMDQILNAEASAILVVSHRMPPTYRDRFDRVDRLDHGQITDVAP